MSRSQSFAEHRAIKTAADHIHILLFIFKTKGYNKRRNLRLLFLLERIKMAMKITALMENQAPENLLCEHGLCVHIAYGGKNFLLDTGSSNAFTENARLLDIDLSKVDMAFLSHAHYDHSGGYEGFFAINDHAPVYLQSAAKDTYYFKIAGPLKKDIGIPDKIPEKYSHRFCYADGDRKLTEGVYLLSHHTPDLDIRGKRAHMYRSAKGHLTVDDFSHEQSIVFEVKDGLVVFNSCCHGGVENIIQEVKTAFPGKNILAVIGGFHLMGVTGVESCAFSDDEIHALGRLLAQANVKKYYTGHCTGRPAFTLLKEELPEKLEYFMTGTVLEFEE